MSWVRQSWGHMHDELYAQIPQLATSAAKIIYIPIISANKYHFSRVSDHQASAAKISGYYIQEASC